MELAYRYSSLASHLDEYSKSRIVAAICIRKNNNKGLTSRNGFQINQLFRPSHRREELKWHVMAKKNMTVTSALPETAASVVITATVVGAAANLLMKRTKVSKGKEATLKTCEDCNGTGICSECNGEGFVSKKLSEESFEKARMNAKNAATRYTSGLPKKWTYCTKCSSARSCATCGGRGKLIQ